MSERERDQPTEDDDGYLWDRGGPEDAEVKRLEGLLRPLRFSGELPPLPKRAAPAVAAGRGLRASFALTAAAALAIAAAAVLSIVDEPKKTTVARVPSATPTASEIVAVPTPPTTSAALPAPSMMAMGPSCSAGEAGLVWKAVQGAPTCGGQATGGGQLPKGTWLETDASSKATLEVADIGHVEIDASSRVRVVETGPSEHRLELARGGLHAKINAPPRLFFVETKAATAIDLGCEYELDVDEQGAGLLRVLTGYVELARPSKAGGEPRAALVPAGAQCVIDPVRGPGTPIWSSSNEAAKKAMAAFDRSGSADDLRAVLDALDKKDTLSVFHLLERVPVDQRGALVDRLRKLAPAPKEAPREETISLQPAAVDAWRTTLEPTWFPE